jgi:hypothetical protein
VRRTSPFCLIASAALFATAASAQPWYIPVPTVTAGTTEVKVEMERTNTSINNVQATFVANNTAGTAATKSNMKVYIGPSTVTTSPLLDLTPIAKAGGMVVLEPEAGLNAVEVSFEIEEAPIRTAWKLPLLTFDDFFVPNSTAYVQNLVKAADAQSSLQIFNADNTEGFCKVDLLRPKGSLINERSNLTLPAGGVLMIGDILNRVPAASASGINAAVTCSTHFYALGALPSTNRWNTRVEYPIAKLPANLVGDVMADEKGTFLHVTRNDSDLKITLPFDAATNYHQLQIDFDIRVVDPPAFVVFRNVVGMFRKGGRRFGKTLYFGSFENFNKEKYVIDVGTPYIETTLKRNFPLRDGHTYHFSITLNNDQQSDHYTITQGNTVIMDVLGGLYNAVNVVDGNAPVLEFGLDGVADNAYFPPFGWQYQNLKIVASH